VGQEAPPVYPAGCCHLARLHHGGGCGGLQVHGAVMGLMLNEDKHPTVRRATLTEQARNTRRNAIVIINGQRMTLVEAAERLGVKYNSLENSLRRGTPFARNLGVNRVQ